MNSFFVIGILLGSLLAFAIFGASVPFITDLNEKLSPGKIIYIAGLVVGIIMGSAICFIIYNHVKAR